MKEKRSFSLKPESIRKLFSSSHNEIAHVFLISKLGLSKTDQNNFEKVRNKTIVEFDLDPDSVPSTSEEFNEFVCQEILNLKALPRDKLFDLLQEALDDLKFIEQMKSKHHDKIELLRTDKNIEGKKYRLDRHYHYLKKLKKDEDQIVKFLRDDLFQVSFSQALPNQWPPFFIYPFKGASVFYVHENLCEINNKVGFVPLGELSKYAKLHQSNPARFYSLVKKHLVPTKLIKKIKENIRENHILYKKGKFLRKLLSYYDSKEYETFSNICPQQIEGLFYDLAIYTGVKHNTLKTSVISDKVRHINDKSDLFNDFQFEYYSFVFPVIRNRITHGVKIEGGFSNTAYSLLVDLHEVCEFFVSHKFKMNEAVFIMRKIEEDNQDLYYLIKYIDFLGTRIEPHYKPKYTDSEIKKFLETEFKMSKINKRVKPGTGFAMMIPNAAKKLKQMNINPKECDLAITNYSVDYR